MDRNEFLEEVLNSGIAPDNFEKIYKEFNDYQDLVYDTLIEFARVCKKRNVRYQLAYGTLLGAVRDGGQIPWDYDADVLVPYEEKEKLVAALSEELNPDYYFYCPEVDEKCRHEIIRVTPKGYKSEILHVDVFWMIGVSGNTKERDEIINRVQYLCDCRFSKLVNIKEESYGHPRRYLKLMKRKLSAAGKSIEDMHREYQSICSNHPVNGSILSIEADIFAKDMIFPSKEMWQLKSMNLNGIEFLIPADPDAILPITYKNYKQIPPLESRLKELLWRYEELQHAKK